LSHTIFREGRVHVCSRLCETCIFRPGNLMNLREGVVESMVAGALAIEGVIVCHSTLDGEEHLVCRGFFERHPTSPLQVASRLGFLEEVDPPPGTREVTLAAQFPGNPGESPGVLGSNGRREGRGGDVLR